MNNELRFRHIVEQYRDGSLAADKQALMDEFFETLATDEEGIDVFEWTEADKLALKNKILSAIDAQEKSTMTWRDTKLIAIHWFKVAAAVALIMTLSYWALKPWTDVEYLLVSNVVRHGEEGKTTKVMLTDGSIVWLKGNSSLTYPEKFESTTRRVILEGDALFEIAKDPSSPFVIECDELTAKVLGTSFSVKSSGGDIELMVLTGKVLASTKSDKDGIEILPHEKVIYVKKSNELKKIEVIKEEEDATVTNTEYSMRFDDTPLYEIVRRLEGKFNVQVNVSNERLNNCVITVDLTDQSLDRTLSIMARTLRFEYKVDGSAITLSGEGCDRIP